MNYIDPAEVSFPGSTTQIAEVTSASKGVTAASREPVTNGQKSVPVVPLLSSFASKPQFTKSMEWSAFSIPGRGNSSSTMAAPVSEENMHILKSQTVGIFRASKAAGAHPFVELGTMVGPGQVVGMIEILRLMVDVKSDVSGEITKKLAGDGEPVDYGQPLFAVRSSQ